jgi:protein DGCR14
MPPPAAKVQALKNKAILPEEDYVAALGRIIQRDFYPDLPRLRDQLEWLSSVNPKDAALARSIILSEQHSWGEELGDAPSAAADDAAADDDEAVETSSSLSKFLAGHTSEDNESFQHLLHRMQEAHRRSHWWAYDGAAAPHLLLHNGQRLDAITAAAMESAAAAKTQLGDDRPGAIESWAYRYVVCLSVYSILL